MVAVLMWGLLLALGVVMVLVGSALLASRPARWDWPLSARRTAASCREAAAATVEPLGRGGAAVAILLAGMAATVAICWPLGRLARRTETGVDHPLFRFAEKRHTNYWDHINEFFTGMGNRPQIKLVCVIAIVVLTVLWRKRQWWVPALVIATAFFGEKVGQMILGKVVDRGHPPTTLGTYPSGGCGRLVAIYGTILFLALLTAAPVSRRVNYAVWTLFAVAAFVEGYTRIYLLKHWFTDVIAGWIYGSLVLGVLVATTMTLLGRGSVTAASRFERSAVASAPGDAEDECRVGAGESR